MRHQFKSKRYTNDDYQKFCNHEIRCEFSPEEDEQTNYEKESDSKDETKAQICDTKLNKCRAKIIEKEKYMKLRDQGLFFQS